MRHRKETGRFNFWSNNTARTHLTRALHTELLATPNYRRLEEIDSRDIPNLKLGEGPVWPVSRAAMKTKASPRIEKLSKSKHDKEVIQEEDKPRPDRHLSGVYPGGHYASEAALKTVCSNRIQHLAIPKRNHIKAQKQEFSKQMNPKLRNQIDVLEDMANRTIYPHRSHEHIQASKADEERKSYVWPKKSRQLNTYEDWEKHYEWLDTRAAPKRRISQTKQEEEEKVEVKKGLPLEVLQEGAKRLAVPRKRKVIILDDDEIYQVPQSALDYEITERVNELAKPRQITTPIEERPAVSKAALKYEASERIKEIAQHTERKQAPEMDVRENPFEVSPAALTAKCSPRIKKLAEPVER